jgi:microcystin-dependent protein
MSNPFLSTTQVNAVIRIRRGPDVDRFQFVYDDGELIYSTDKKRLYIGDGVNGTGTYGGTLVANKVWMSDSFDKLPYIEKFDLVYRTDSCGFYVLTGEQYLLPSNYIPIGGKKLINDNVVMPQAYSLPFATTTSHGGIIVSNGLRIDDGKLSLDINPNYLRSVNNRLEVITDNLINDIPNASYTTYGKVRVGQNNGIDIASGTLGLRIDPNTLTINENNELKVSDNVIEPLPYASETTYGRVKINPNNGISVNDGNIGIKLDTNTLEVNANNELKVIDSIATPLPYASQSVYGKVKINPNNALSINNGNLGINIDANTLSVNANNELTVIGGAGGGNGGTLASYTTNGTIQISPNNGLNITGGNLSLGINPNTLSINGSNELQVNTSSILNSLSYASYTDYGKIKINSSSALGVSNGVLSLKFDSTKLSINGSNELTVIGGNGGISPPIASYSTNGTVQITQNTGINVNSGNISVAIDNNTIKLSSTPIGSVLYTDFTQSKYATSIAAGIVRPTNGLNITSGELSVKVDNSTIKISPTSGLYVAGGTGTTNVFDSTPVGTINWFADSVAPTGYLECNGDVFQQSLYPDLYAIIGKKFNIGGEATTSFRLPDLRGEFIRGWDHGKGVDTGRIFGSWQKGSIVGHDNAPVDAPNWAAVGMVYTNGDSPQTITLTAMGLDNYNTVEYPNIGMGSATSTGNTATLPQFAGDRGSSGITRPRNVALLPCIKAVKTVTGTPSLLNFIEKPSPATNGQLLTYNGSTNTWVASAAPPTGTSIGVGQTWQNVTASRTAGVTYTNTTGRTITVIVGGSVGVNATWTFTVDGIQFTYAVTGGSFGSGSSHTCPIPAGSTYSASGFAQWLELR